MELSLIFTLLCLFQLKHYLCDFPLQNEYMLGKFLRTGWVKPLIYHCSTHALSTILIVSSVCAYFNPFYNFINLVLFAGFFDFCIHFITDRIKAHPDLGGKYKPTESKFWNNIGLDQMVHHLTHYVIIYVVATSI